MGSIRGIRKDGTNATTLENITAATAVNVLTPTTGMSFVLTDLIIQGRMTNVASPVTMPVIRFFDTTSGGSTAPGAATQKFSVNMPIRVIPAQESTGGAILFGCLPQHITNIQNGPEFSTAVSVASIGFTHFVVSAYAVWVGGVER